MKIKKNKTCIYIEKVEEKKMELKSINDINFCANNKNKSSSKNKKSSSLSYKKKRAANIGLVYFQLRDVAELLVSDQTNPEIRFLYAPRYGNLWKRGTFNYDLIQNKLEELKVLNHDLITELEVESYIAKAKLSLAKKESGMSRDELERDQPLQPRLIYILEASKEIIKRAKEENRKVVLDMKAIQEILEELPYKIG